MCIIWFSLSKLERKYFLVRKEKQLENIMLTEINQSEKGKHHMISLVGRI